MGNDLKVYQPKLKDTARLWRRMLYSKIENIFDYNNVPEEIPLRFFKLALFKTGKLVFYKIGDKYTVQPFSYNDILNWYYVPEKGRVVNPYLPSGHQNWEFTVDDEAVIYNSTPDIYNYRGFSIVADLIFKTANQLSENDISYYCIQRNHRLFAIFIAQTDLQKREVNEILEKMYNGDTDITMQEDLISKITANPISMNSTRAPLTELIEFQQYVLANFYHSFGINSNYNLKREQLNSNEIDVNKEVLRLNIDDMLKIREDGVSKINEKYGLNISVCLNEEVYQTLLQEAENIDPKMSQNETKSISVNNESEENKNDGRTETEENNSTEEKDSRTDSTRGSDTEHSRDDNKGNGSEQGSDNTSGESNGRGTERSSDTVEENRNTTDNSSEQNTSDMGGEKSDKNDKDDESNTDRPLRDEQSGERSDTSESNSENSSDTDVGLTNNSSPGDTENGNNNDSTCENVININLNLHTDNADIMVDEISEISQNETNEKEGD